MKHVRDGQYDMAGSCVVFGDFDGVTTGHRAAVEKLLETAAARGLTPVLVSFDRDTAGDGEILTSEEEKHHLLRDRPVELMVSIPPRPVDEAFVKEVLSDKLGAKAVVAGANHDKLKLLRDCGGKYGFDVIECEVVQEDGAPVEAKRAMKALLAGDLETAERLMGHPHTVYGKVVPGKQLGRTIGQPTANISFVQNKLLPPDGSYVTVTTLDGVRHVGLANIGRRPTVDDFDYKTVENHIMNFSGNLYGKELALEIHRFIRPVQKFKNLDEVKVQIVKDVAAIRDYIDSLK
jgi:riboflavin kinase/FMN adenylyltransferase